MPLRTKKFSYGSCKVDCRPPAPATGWPPAVNIKLTFEAALRLQLALQARLLAINSLNRATKQGKAARATLCLFTDINRITVT